MMRRLYECEKRFNIYKIEEKKTQLSGNAKKTMEQRHADEIKEKEAKAEAVRIKNTPPPVEESAPVVEDAAPEAPAAEGEAPAEA